VARRFVLAPLAELCPERVVPGTGRTVAQLLALAPPEDLAPAGLYPL
jgi:7,8-dihydro-6-hydroxymethylpterin-pyrophosphokinase